MDGAPIAMGRPPHHDGMDTPTRPIAMGWDVAPPSRWGECFWSVPGRRTGRSQVGVRDTKGEETGGKEWEGGTLKKQYLEEREVEKLEQGYNFEN